jgi:hypothetical protein
MNRCTYYAAADVSLENGDKRTMFVNCDTDEIKLVYSHQDATAFDLIAEAYRCCEQHTDEVYDKVLKSIGSEAIKYMGLSVHEVATAMPVCGKVVGYRYMYIHAIEYTGISIENTFVAYNDGKITFVKDAKDALSFTTPTAANCWLADHNAEFLEQYDIHLDEYLGADLVDRETYNQYTVLSIADEDFNYITVAHTYFEEGVKQ